MSVCSSSTAQQRGKDGCLWSEGRLQRRLDCEERVRSSDLLLSVLARVVGALGLLCVLDSVGGQSFVAPFFTAPRGQCCVFSLDVAVGQVGGHKRKYAVMVLSSSRAIVKVSMLSLLLGALFLSLGVWCSRSRFSRDGPDGAHLGPTGKKDSFSLRCLINGKSIKSVKAQRRSSVSKKLLDLKGESALACTFVVKTNLWTCRYVERFHIHRKRNFLRFLAGRVILSCFLSRV